MTVSVYDPMRNVVKSWPKSVPLNISKSRGFVSSEFQLSSQPNLGYWRIVAMETDRTIDKSMEEQSEEIEETTNKSQESASESSESEEDDTDVTQSTQTFSVEEYILPKFSVELTPTPTFLYFNKSSVLIQIQARYTHGKGVRARCTLILNVSSA